MTVPAVEIITVLIEMKVLIVNGSPHLSGCTDRALREVEETLKANGVDTERVNVGIRTCEAASAAISAASTDGVCSMTL